MSLSLPRTGSILAAIVLVACTSAGTNGTAPDGAPDEQEQPVTRLDYGDDPSQFVDLVVPPGEGAVPVVVLLHGGFWSDQYGLDLMAPLARDLQGRGYATANVEYRRVGSGGGFPATFTDVAAAVDALADVQAVRALDLDRVAVIGHSAGGQLAVWAASRGALPADAPGAAPRVVPCAAVSQAGVLALADASRSAIGGAAVTAFIGVGPDEDPDRYRLVDPVALTPPDAPILLVHAPRDRLVPIEQSRAYLAAAPDHAELAEVDGDHFTVIDPADASWGQTVDWLDDRC